MRSVSDNSATAPISALTYAFIFVSNRGLQTDDFGRRIIAKPSLGASGVKQLDSSAGLDVVRSKL